MHLTLESILFLWMTSVAVIPETTIDMRMPSFDPMSTRVGLRVCIARSFHFSEPQYLTNITLLLRKDSRLHFSLNVCEFPGFDGALHDESVVWDCDQGTGVDPALPKGRICRNGLPFPLMGADYPPDTGLVMPAGTGVPLPTHGYIVFLVHYHDRSLYQANPGLKDRTGVELTFVSKLGNPEIKDAGLLIMDVLTGMVPPHQLSVWENACVITSETDFGEMRLHAVWDHTHASGSVSSVWKVDGETEVWSLIARLNPQDHTKRSPIERPDVVLKKGDIIASRCVLNRTMDSAASISYAPADEMCIFNLYYTTSGSGLVQTYCPTPTDSQYKWATDARLGGVSSLVDYMASHLY